MLQYLFALLPMAAACGWWMGRSHSRGNNIQLSPKIRRDYFKGLNYLINEQPDKAVDVFIKLLEVDSDTIETHFALGSLFRRRGEVDRAIRIHQNLIARPQLAKSHRMQALSELGQDYLSAGVLDRAERLFLQLVELGDNSLLSLRFLLSIYQQEKDWDKAIDIAQKMQAAGSDMSTVIAQYYCELAEQTVDKGRTNQALQHLKRAQVVDSHCVRASLIRAKIEVDGGRYKEALRCYKRVIEQDPDYISEIIQPLVSCFRQLGDEEKMVAYLQDCLQRYQRIALVLAISDNLQKNDGDKAAMDFIAKQIQCQPSLRGLSQLVRMYVGNSQGDARDKLLILDDFVNQLLANKPIYRCHHCGFSSQSLYWLCPSCHHWKTIKPIQGVEGS